MINSPHLYFDGTYIFPSGFSQKLIVLYYNKETNKKFPGAYILINNKYEKSYIKAFTVNKNIITLEGEKELEMISYSSDYELALSNALETVFPNKRHLDCYSHYSYNLDKNLKNLVFSKIFKENNDTIINNDNTEKIIKLKENAENRHKEILIIPFKIQNIYNIIDIIIEKYKDQIYRNFKSYFKNNGNYFLKIDY